MRGALCRSDDVWSCSAGDRAILYFWDEGKSITLNSTGTVLWDALQSPRTAQELCDVLVDRFPGLPAERVRADVAAFLDRLLRESVLQAAPEMEG